MEWLFYTYNNKTFGLYFYEFENLKTLTMNLRQQRDKSLRPYYDIKRLRMQLKFNDAYYYSMESLGLPVKQHDNSLRNGLYKACISG